MSFEFFSASFNSFSIVSIARERISIFISAVLIEDKIVSIFFLQFSISFLSSKKEIENYLNLTLYQAHSKKSNHRSEFVGAQSK